MRLSASFDFMLLKDLRKPRVKYLRWFST